jgi:LAO/AO transport system kinase
MTSAELAARLRAGERAALAQALNRVDDARPAERREALALLDGLERESGAAGARRIGITGAPGVGKSTLLDGLVRALRARGETVGVIAVDPSSRRTGGALLGDRVRVRSAASDPGVFFRSMAARERLGGLAEPARASVIVLGAAFDVVLVETVGVGQSESEVADLVDTLAFVTQPGAGDLLQFMKAGVLELPDVFVVNKADQGPLAERTARELEAGLGLGERADAGARARVVLASARDGRGIDELLAALDDHGARLAGAPLAERRHRGRDRFVTETLRTRYGTHGLTALGGADALAKRIDAEPSASGFALVERLGTEIEEALRR